MTMEAPDNPMGETQPTKNDSNMNNNQPKARESENEGVERHPPTGEPSEASVKTSLKNEDSQQDQNSASDTEDNDDEGLDLGDTTNYDSDARNALFQRGLECEKKGKQKSALQCYFGCIQGLQSTTKFAFVPECLHNIAEIFDAQGKYEQAIHFAQAEKLFYESALIETQEIQKRIEEVAGSESSPQATDLNDLNIEAMRAEEYEHLARLCLDKNQAQLALEYAGKCAKIRQSVYGDNHRKTKETLDFFASLYAEVGKEQYSDSFTLLNNMTPEEFQTPRIITSPSPSGEPVSILRQRTSGQKKDEGAPGQAEREKKQVRFHESVQDTSDRDREEFFSLTVTLFLLIVCFLILISLGLWLFCSLDRGQICYNIAGTVKAWIMNVRYYFHTHQAPKIAYPR